MAGLTHGPHGWPPPKKRRRPRPNATPRSWRNWARWASWTIPEEWRITGQPTFGANPSFLLDFHDFPLAMWKISGDCNHLKEFVTGYNANKTPVNQWEFYPIHPHFFTTGKRNGTPRNWSPRRFCWFNLVCASHVRDFWFLLARWSKLPWQTYHRCFPTAQP